VVRESKITAVVLMDGDSIIRIFQVHVHAVVPWLDQGFHSLETLHFEWLGFHKSVQVTKVNDGTILARIVLFLH
jgi:hypothetical protein